MLDYLLVAEQDGLNENRDTQRFLDAHSGLSYERICPAALMSV